MTGPLLDYFRAPLLQTRGLARREHRPWPIPRRPWLLGQTWLDLLFVHWRVPAGVMREHVPRVLALDTFDGDAWLGVTPFELRGLRPSFGPPLPGASRFAELNVRTYVAAGGKPGILFFSLDAGSRLAVEAARRLYRLPYRHAETRIERAGGVVSFPSERSGDPARFSARYVPGKPLPPAVPGTVEHFLTERYCLYAIERGRLYRAEIHHPRWRLREADAVLDFDSLLPAGIVPTANPLLHYSEREDVLVWPLRVVRGPR
jgi:uncharacterized protein